MLPIVLAVIATLSITSIVLTVGDDDDDEKYAIMFNIENLEYTSGSYPNGANFDLLPVFSNSGVLYSGEPAFNSYESLAVVADTASNAYSGYVVYAETNGDFWTAIVLMTTNTSNRAPMVLTLVGNCNYNYLEGSPGTIPLTISVDSPDESIKIVPTPFSKMNVVCVEP